MSEFFKKMKDSKVMHFIKIVTESASFALFLSIIFFTYEMVENMRESKDVTDNLLKIQNSLTTKYLGEFPNFVPDINKLYSGGSPGDSIVIIEDVLFYGITSAPEDFYDSNLKLLDLAAKGCPIMIAYYNPSGLTYNLMVQEWLLSNAQYKNYRDTLRVFYKRHQMYRQERKATLDSCSVYNLSKGETDVKLLELLEKCFGDIIEESFLIKQKEYMLDKPSGQKNSNQDRKALARNENELIKEYLLEHYFAQTRETDKKGFESMVTKYRRPTLKNYPSSTILTQTETKKMCQSMDSIRIKHLGKEHTSAENIKYVDFLQMFTEMTNVMVETYSRYPSIVLVPIDDFLSVRGWLVCGDTNGSQAIIAFPSRYSSSEIGFYTTDESMKNYIRTMQTGILINYAPTSLLH